MSGLSSKQYWSISSLSRYGTGEDEARLHHGLMLMRCFDGEEMRWSDALVTRMRRHLGGCLASVETALRLEVSALGPVGAQCVDALPEGQSWRTVMAVPSLVDRTLLDHFRDRAAIGLMQQDPYLAMADGEGANSAPDLLSGELAEALSALMLAQGSWADNGPDERPLRADLPAEFMPDLVWTVAAILADALATTGLVSAREAAGMIDRAGLVVLARHDEENAPYARAAMLAHRLRALDLHDEALHYLSRKRQVLLLLALIADRLNVGLATLIDAAMTCTEQWFFSLCRAADFPREVAVRLVLGRRCVARGVDDSMLVEYADGYELLSRIDAAAMVAALTLAEPLRAKLELLGLRAGRDGR